MQGARAAPLRIVDEGLKAPLDAAGGALPRTCRALRLRAVRLTQANLHNDVAALDECVRLLEPVRRAWVAIGPAASAAAADRNDCPAPTPTEPA